MLTFFRSILVINAIAGFFPLDASSQLYSEAGGSVVKIHIFGTLKKASESGSIDFEEFGTGFYATPDGLILTAGHLIPDRSEFIDNTFFIEVSEPVLKGDAWVASKSIPATPVVSSRLPNDFALLRVEAENAPLPRPLAMCKGGKVEEKVRVLGYPEGDDRLSGRPGEIERAAVGTTDLLEITNHIRPADSGAPLFGEHNRVIGVVFGIRENEPRRPGFEPKLATPVFRAIQALAPQGALLKGSFDQDCGATVNSFRAQKKTPISYFSIPILGSRSERRLTINMPIPEYATLESVSDGLQLNEIGNFKLSIENMEIKVDRVTDEREVLISTRVISSDFGKVSGSIVSRLDISGAITPSSKMGYSVQTVPVRQVVRLSDGGVVLVIPFDPLIDAESRPPRIMKVAAINRSTDKSVDLTSAVRRGGPADYDYGIAQSRSNFLLMRVDDINSVLPDFDFQDQSWVFEATGSFYGDVF